MYYISKEKPLPKLPEITLPYACGQFEATLIFNRYILREPINKYWLVSLPESNGII